MTGLSLREAALQAAEDAQATRVGAARGVLANVLQPVDVAALSVVEDGGEVLVFADGDGTSLSVRGNVVTLVTGGPGEWTGLGVVASLAELGVMLDAG